jgi:hypothetical protein
VEKHIHSMDEDGVKALVHVLDLVFFIFLSSILMF